MRLKPLLLAMTVLMGVQAGAQNYDKSNTFVYNVLGYTDTNTRTIVRVGEQVLLADMPIEGTPIPGYSSDRTIADYGKDSIYYEVSYPTEVYLAAVPMRSGIKWDTIPMDGKKVKYKCSINSNTLEFVVATGVRYEVTPMPNYGRLGGVLLEYWRNGMKVLELKSHSYDKKLKAPELAKGTIAVSPYDIDKIKTNHLVQTTRIFDDVQLCWGKEKSVVEGDIPFDSVLHFAGGTLAFKRIRLPQLSAHYQHYLELHQYSNGDAYDRTGCVFVIPHRNGVQPAETFFEGLRNSVENLPIFTDRSGKTYQGISRKGNYEPIVELMRFFTSFGVRHFNDRVKIDGLEWRDENYYKQDVTELSDLLSGDVWVGIWIGNYDGGGHKVTLDLKSYPGDYVMGEVSPRYKEVLPLFATTNVLEMAGQNYGQLFGTDSLTVEFDIPEDAKNVRLRYITTGHGGWGGGDEFNPKANTIIVDGKDSFVYTPWRCDCGRYREWNPVSGNSWDGLTSSDYSRSGWCPGTATQPTYFDLGAMKAGRHTLTVAIPQGAQEGGSISHWCVSGVLFVE